MLKQQLTERVVSIILTHVRGKRGRLTTISEESGVNRKMFKAEELANIQLYRLLRVFYTLEMVVSKKEFEKMMNEICDTLEGFAEKYDYKLLDE